MGIPARWRQRFGNLPRVCHKALGLFQAPAQSRDLTQESLRVAHPGFLQTRFFADFL
jgi:hypothetical protein